jgi:hypothetical protein
MPVSPETAGHGIKMVLGAQLNRHVLSEIWTAPAQVDCDVQHRPDRLALGTRVLQVESAQ